MDEIRDKKGRFVKGVHYNSKTEFKKGNKSNVGKKRPGWTNKGSFRPKTNMWDTNNREYQAIHRWIKSQKGQPKVCEICKKDTYTPTQYHWANKSGKYLRDISDWLRLCYKCHYVYDREKIAIKRVGNEILSAFNKKQLILIAGNGGSMSMAQHWAGELVSKFERDRKAIGAVALGDPNIITAIGNDMGFENIFARQVEALGHKDGVLICLTTSDVDESTGHSLNLWKALGEAVNKKKMRTVVMGSEKTKRMKNYAGVFIKGKGIETAEIQDDQQRLIHLICRFVETKIIYNNY